MTTGIGGGSVGNTFQIGTAKERVDFTKAYAGVSGSFSGSFSGDASGLTVATASYALNAASASYAVSASHEIIKEISSSHADTAAGLTGQPSILVTNITASGDISASGTIGTGDTYIDFTTGDEINFWAGGERLLKLEETGTDSVVIGDSGHVNFRVATSGYV